MPRTSKVRDLAIEPIAAVLPVRDAVLFPGQIHTLHVAREGSKRAVRQTISDSKVIFVVAQRDQTVEDPSPGDLHRIGTLCEPLQAVPLPDGSLRVALRCLKRAEAKRFNRRGGTLTASYAAIPETSVAGIESEALMRASVEAFSEIVERDRRIPAEALESVVHQETPGALADAIAHHLQLPATQKQTILEVLDPGKRLQTVYDLLKREAKVLSVQREISEKVDREFATTQREHFLREQIRAIQSELSTLGGEDAETVRLRAAIEVADMPLYAREKALHELARLESALPQSAEAMVIRNYIDWMASLPWSKLSPDRLNIDYAQSVLDQAHYGLEHVKDRILDYLAVRQLSQSLRGPILCFVGPPGVGKTSAGKSIADALGREFVRISLGGLRDEAEVRGHRRTYVGSLPGKILQSIRQCGTRNPVIVLDEIDKLASDWRGDPSSALLEALDPAQNERFADHYLEVPFDLSEVLFIATANMAEGIPHALRDRMEFVRFNSYTDEERIRIAERHLLPRQLALHGLQPERCRIAPSALEKLVMEYSREAGVRELERSIAAVCRKVARRIAESKRVPNPITGSRLASLIGPPRHVALSRLAKGEVGAANCMVVTEYGGEILPIEALLLERAREGSTLQLTGNMGAVMRESAEAALSYIRSGLAGLGPTPNAGRDVHIHVPDNAVPKEGPSAGISIVAALASAMTGRAVRGDVALTGEITLRGRVLPIGGLREKLIAAQRAGIRTVVIPAENEPDLADVPKKVLSQLKVECVETASQALRIALVPEARSAVIESETLRRS